MNDELKSRVDEAISRFKVDSELHGLAEGFSTGWECGEYRTIRNFTLRLLRHRCGDLPKKIEERVYELPDSYIYSLAEAMFDFTSQEDLRIWLEAKEDELWQRRCDAMNSVRFLI